MLKKTISKEVFDFLKKLEKNNNRDWFNTHKMEFKVLETEMKSIFNTLAEQFKADDDIDRVKVFRIYRDVRFSKNKTPYKINFSSSMSRSGPQLRGGYYTHIQPNNASFIAAGFWQPEKSDLYRIRKELELDATEFRTIINQKSFKDTWGELSGEELKLAPKGFNKNHENIDLIKKKQFIFTRKFTDDEVLDVNFLETVRTSFKAIRPYFDLMSDILTTDLNGESILN